MNAFRNGLDYLAHHLDNTYLMYNPITDVDIMRQANSTVDLVPILYHSLFTNIGLIAAPSAMADAMGAIIADESIGFSYIGLNITRNYCMNEIRSLIGICLNIPCRPEYKWRANSNQRRDRCNTSPLRLLRCKHGNTLITIDAKYDQFRFNFIRIFSYFEMV